MTRAVGDRVVVMNEHTLRTDPSPYTPPCRPSPYRTHRRPALTPIPRNRASSPRRVASDQSRRDELLERLEDRAVLFASVGLRLGPMEARHARDVVGEPLEDLHGDLRLGVLLAPLDHRIARGDHVAAAVLVGSLLSLEECLRRVLEGDQRHGLGLVVGRLVCGVVRGGGGGLAAALVGHLGESEGGEGGVCGGDGRGAEKAN
ncbi:hypothetical protein Ctob_012257, partial [Chrysochromulina tobinii]